MPTVSTLLRCAAALALLPAAAATAEPSFVPTFETNFPDPHIVEHG